MKRSGVVLSLVGAVVLAHAGNAQAPQSTPAQQRIAAANKQIASDPKDAEAYDGLALAYLARAHETASPDHDRQAAEAIATGFRLAPKDYQLRKTQVVLFLDRHEFAHARDEAKDLSLPTPDDAAVRGYLAQADMGLGDWPAAEESAQWALNLLPFNVPALLIAADIRDHYGERD